MPVIKSAIKKLRQTKKKTAHNQKIKSKAKELMRAFKAKPGKKALAAVFSALDKAAKVNIFHRNKAARLKSRLSKLLKS